jgi:hypothetical protein
MEHAGGLGQVRMDVETVGEVEIFRNKLRSFKSFRNKLGVLFIGKQMRCRSLIDR